MTIFVIGKSAKIRREIARKLRDEGHDVSTASLHPGEAHEGFRTVASRDPGHAGRHLRRILEGAGSRLVDLWRSGRVRARQGPRPIDRFEDRGS